MKNICLSFLFCVSFLLCAHGQEAGHCIVLSKRTEFGSEFWNLRNACPATVIVYYVATHPAKGDSSSGNDHIDPEKISETMLHVEGGIETYTCYFPHVPRNADGNTPHRPTNGYSCK